MGRRTNRVASLLDTKVNLGGICLRDINIKKMMKLKILQKKMVLKMKIIIKKKAFIKLVECAHMNFELSACCSLQLVCWSKLELRLQGGNKETGTQFPAIKTLLLLFLSYTLNFALHLTLRSCILFNLLHCFQVCCIARQLRSRSRSCNLIST